MPTDIIEALREKRPPVPPEEYEALYPHTAVECNNAAPLLRQAELVTSDHAMRERAAATTSDTWYP